MCGVRNTVPGNRGDQKAKLYRVPQEAIDYSKASREGKRKESDRESEDRNLESTESSSTGLRLQKHLVHAGCWVV